MYYRGRANPDKAQLARAKAKHELAGSTRTLFVGTAGVAGEGIRLVVSGSAFPQRGTAGIAAYLQSTVFW